MKITGLFIARIAMCAAIIGLYPQAQSAASARASIPGIGSPRVVLCGPGLVYRCSTKGCFCVKP
jgi:hypothetical protein